MPFRVPSSRAVTPGGQGRFPGFDILDEVDRWDDVTAGVVLARLDPQPEVCFFTPAEQATADALFDRLLAQDKEPKVPVLLLVDRRLALGQTDGWRYESMPEDAEAWRRTLAALEAEARDRHDDAFHHLTWRAQGELIAAVQAAPGDWRGFPAKHVWSLWTRYACTAFYSHPWAWNEIGFPGPAYPRGYKTLGMGRRECREVADHDDADPVDFAKRIERASRRHRAEGGYGS